ncbi:MAG: mechanosensitive ion channel [Legionellaceae bacterium]|nr:mechanosensitive ion channel [Legionellaceae bacterium]
MNRIVMLISTYVFFFALTSGLARALPVTDEAPAFNTESANKILQRINHKAAASSISSEQLSTFVNRLQYLSDQAQSCINRTTSQIATIDGQIKAILGDVQEDASRADANFLRTNKQKLIDEQAQCQLFLFEAEQAISNYKKQIVAIHQKTTFTRGLFPVGRIQQVVAELQALEPPNLKSTGVAISGFTVAFYMALLWLLSWAVLFFMQIELKKYLGKKLTGWRELLCMFLLLGLLILSGSRFQPFVETADASLYYHSLGELLFIVAMLLFIQIGLALRSIRRGLSWYGFDIKFFKTILLVVILIYGIRILGRNLLLLYGSDQELRWFYGSIIMYLSLMATVYFSYQFYRKHRRMFASVQRAKSLFRLICFVAVAVVILDTIGFYVLAMRMSLIFFLSLLILALGLVLFRGLSQAYRYVNEDPLARKVMKRYFNYQNDPPYLDLAFLNLLIQISFFLMLIGLFSYLSGDASYLLDHFMYSFFHGFNFAGNQLVPINWLTGAFLFSIIMFATRYIASRFNQRVQLNDEEEEIQVALASILLYAGCAIGIVLGLMIAGFSFTSLAIVAGALSVGIGLGLQSIVNDFVSGLILLVEKPFKTGDRIAVDSIEGFVKKIRIRTTHLVTPSKEDIIIPNSGLISERVTNYMFLNKSVRIKCSIGVAYGSNIELVQSILLDIARQHTDVINTKSNQPSVFLREFSDNALLFELWCMIRDVNKKYQVLHEINIAIEKAFREHHINIPFPQREVHIQLDDIKGLDDNGNAKDTKDIKDTKDTKGK